MARKITTVIKDVILHIKNKEEGVGVVEKINLPVTRWENVAGAPRLLNEHNIAESFPSEYAIYETNDIVISDAEYAACFEKVNV